MSYEVEELTAPSLDVTDDSLSASRSLKITPYSSIFDYLADLYGINFVAGGTVVRGGMVTFPGKPWLILKSVGVEPFNDEFITGVDGNGLATTDEARVTLKYEAAAFGQGDEDDNQPDDSPGAYMTWKVTGSQSMLTHSLSSLEWEEANDDGVKALPEDMNPGEPISIITHDVTWHQVPRIPWATIRSCLNRTNDGDFLSATDAETILFKSFEFTQTTHIDGSIKFELVYHFAERIVDGAGLDGGNPVAVGWNHFLRPDAGAAQADWQRIVNKSGDKLLPPTDLSALFRFTTSD